MRYIRTKDGRIIEVREGFEGKEWENSKKYFDKYYLKQADTIEELCDFAYALWEDDAFEVYDLSYHYTLTKDNFHQYLKDGDCKEVFYGVKTDKGLIYVAKMNSKGELELL